jgi:O-acetyl-ADP-ribose deacetylase (regulator of RNase III)
MKEIKGNLITLAKQGNFDVIAHGCNCFCRMGRGIAPQIKEAFVEAWTADQVTESGDFNKLGNYTSGIQLVNDSEDQPIALTIINIYSQYSYDSSTKPLDYDALTLALRKINHNYKGKSIGLPQIGAGLAGGDWNIIKAIILMELKNMDVTIVYYDRISKNNK